MPVMSKGTVFCGIAARIAGILEIMSNPAMTKYPPGSSIVTTLGQTPFLQASSPPGESLNRHSYRGMNSPASGPGVMDFAAPLRKIPILVQGHGCPSTVQPLFGSDMSPKCG